MALDRDLTVALGNAWVASGTAKGWRGWELLSATGVRFLRLLNETEALSTCLLTETHPAAFQVLQANSRIFGARGSSSRRWDARCAPADLPFDLVDLDPYGTPEPFLASALSALAPGGILSVTATDMRVLAGVDRGVCERRYGARPVRGRLGPEGGLRILLAWVSRVAAEHGSGIEPVLSYVGDHYVRANIRVVLRPRGAPAPVATLEPATFGGPRLPGRSPVGPLWVGPLFDPKLVATLTTPRTAERPKETGRFLERLRAEASVDVPFFYEPNELARDLHLIEPPPVGRLEERLLRQGHPLARTHARAGAFRTTAPRSVVEAAAREVSRDPPPRQSQNARVRA